jgi:YVTN family beta-propeller protein
MRNLISLCLAILLAFAACLSAQDPSKRSSRAPKPGVSTPGVRREMSAIKPIATFAVEGAPDWTVVTDDGVWVTSAPKNTVTRLDSDQNIIVAVIPVGKKPCSGLTAGFGSIWVPNCGDKTISRIDIASNKVTTTLQIPPAASEGGIAASDDAVWMVTDAKGILARIDPNSNRVAAVIPVPPNSAGVAYGEGAVWVTSPERNLLTRVDPKTNQVTASVEVGPSPRFLTTGAGSVWTLNQGDGTISRVDAKTVKLVTHITAGIPGTGGQLAFGEGRIWATVFQIPLTEIDPATNQVVKQWFGPGGDSVRVGNGSVWLSNLREQTVWRLNPKQQ